MRLCRLVGQPAGSGVWKTEPVFSGGLVQSFEIEPILINAFLLQGENAHEIETLDPSCDSVGRAWYPRVLFPHSGQWGIQHQLVYDGWGRGDVFNRGELQPGQYGRAAGRGRVVWWQLFS